MRGVLIPDRLSITHMARIPLIYGEQRLHRPALSVISISNPELRPHWTASSNIADIIVVRAKPPGKPYLDRDTRFLVGQFVKGSETVKFDDSDTAFLQIHTLQ